MGQGLFASPDPDGDLCPKLGKIAGVRICSEVDPTGATAARVEATAKANASDSNPVVYPSLASIAAPRICFRNRARIAS